MAKHIQEVAAELPEPPQQSFNPESPSDLYGAEELNPEELEAAILEAKKQKYFVRRNAEYWRRTNQEHHYPEYTAEQVYKYLANTHEIPGGRKTTRFIVNNGNAEVIKKLCMYFAKDKRFEERYPEYSLEKGLLLFGGVGTGKTELINFFFKNAKQSYVVISCRDIDKAYSVEGAQGIAMYGIAKPVNAVNSDPFGHKVLGYCFDDLGTEHIEAKFYGSGSSVMAEVILNRYDGRHSKGIPFDQTHITTNLSSEEIAERYGSRVTDRMVEMFNVVTFPETATSMR